ncbi:hypothetical protein ACFFQW_46680 [Umezawaea endophytica]|uniref:Uncharacterized protein n=1 Tax=Umezawaea endophytica TaxID=1654476 RepID=A0A9X2VVG6_9PSEU|nr:hypothetical protein [Umezawaea endophytica]MCS7483685.1 hypothetical protein [Umezawaea endophytica]
MTSVWIGHGGRSACWSFRTATGAHRDQALLFPARFGHAGSVHDQDRARGLVQGGTGHRAAATGRDQVVSRADAVGAAGDGLVLSPCTADGLPRTTTVSHVDRRISGSTIPPRRRELAECPR